MGWTERESETPESGMALKGRDSSPSRRLVQAILEWGRALDVISAEDVLAAFPPRLWLRAWEHQPEIISTIREAAGLPRRVGESSAALGDRILCAVECGETTAEEVLTAVPDGDFASLLPSIAPPRMVWQFVLSQKVPSTPLGAAFVGAVLEAAVAAGALDAGTLFRAEIIGPHLGSLDRVALEVVARVALGIDKTDPWPVLLQAPPSALVAHVDAGRLWRDEVAPQLAKWEDIEWTTRSSRPAPSHTFRTGLPRTGPSQSPLADRAPAPIPQSENMTLPSLSFDDDEHTISRAPRPSDPFLGEALAEAEAAGSAPRSSSLPPDSYSEREGIVSGLAAVGRLPPNHSDLPLSILVGLEQLYWNLLAADTTAQRREAFRATFPVEADLLVAVAALTDVFFDGGSDSDDLDELIARLEEADRKANAKSLEAPRLTTPDRPGSASRPTRPSRR